MNISPSNRNRNTSSVKHKPQKQKSTEIQSSQNVITYDDGLRIRVGYGPVQSVEQRCRNLTHRLCVGEQRVYIHNLIKEKEVKYSMQMKPQIKNQSHYINKLSFVCGP